MKDETDVTVILDRSGSMEAIASDVIGGFNRFLMDQQNEPGECRLTLVQFDNEYEVVYASRPIREAPPLTADTFQPRGTTALLDALGRTIDATGARFEALDESERPDRVLIIIVTDGLENASTDYTRERVFKMISTQQDVYKWSFLFMAANQDAIDEGSKVGIPAQRTRAFTADGPAFLAASEAMSEAVASFRSTGDARFSDSASAKRNAKNKKKVH
jgi:hypothetical protein